MANKRVSVKGKGADLFFGDYTQPPESTPEQPQEPATSPPPQIRSRNADQPIDRPTDRPTNRSTNRSTRQSTRKPTSVITPNATSLIVGRPKAFYITERLNQRLDEAVVYFQRVHGLRKVDRSTVINAMLDNDEQWEDESLDSLVSRLIAQLTSRLTGR